MTFANVMSFSNYTLDKQIKIANYVRCVSEVQTRQCWFRWTAAISESQHKKDSHKEEESRTT